MTPEGKVKAACRKALRGLGCLVLPYNAQGIGASGVPDDLVMAPGRGFFTIEYKAHLRWDRNNKAALSTLPTMLQTGMMERIRACGFETYVIDDALAAAVLPALGDPAQAWLFPTVADRLAVALGRCRWQWTVAQLTAYRDTPPAQAWQRLDWRLADHACIPTFKET